MVIEDGAPECYRSSAFRQESINYCHLSRRRTENGYILHPESFVGLTDTETGFISVYFVLRTEYSVVVIRLEHHAQMTMIQCQSSLVDFPRVLHRRVPGAYVTLSVTIPLHDNNTRMDIQGQKKTRFKRNILIEY